MWADKHEVTPYDNDELRNQWEKRAQLFNESNEVEQSRRGKSALNGLFKEWGYRLAMRNGVVEKKKGDISDFRKYIIKADKEGEIDEQKLEARFKVKAPPKIAKPPPPPPPKPAKKPPPPKRAPKAPRKPEVDMLKMCWGESWKCLKPPHKQNQKAVVKEAKPAEPKPKNTYKSMGYDLDAKWGSAAKEWTQSWKQPKNPAQMEKPTENMSQWEILSKGKFWRRYDTEIENFTLPVWAGTWKTMIFVMGQVQQNWDRTWPDYKRNTSDKLAKLQHLEEQAQPNGWGDSWKSSKAEAITHDEPEQETHSTALKMEIPNVFLPGWNESWMSTGAHVDITDHCQKNWRTSWGYCQEHRWCKASLESRHRHIDMLMRRRRNKNILLSLGLDEDVPDTTEWDQSWKTSKAHSEEAEYEGEEQGEETEEQGQNESYTEEDYGMEEHMSSLPLHLQFHKLNTPISNWESSWMVSKAHITNEGDGDMKKGDNSAWKDSWKFCDSESQPKSQEGGQDDVVYFSTKHKTQRYVGVKDGSEEGMRVNQWFESWKTTKPADDVAEDVAEDVEQHEQGHEDSEGVYHHFRPERATFLFDFPMSEWKEAWKFSHRTSSSGPSLSQWSGSWRLSHPKSTSQQGCQKHRHHTEITKHHSHFDAVELPHEEWNNSWKQPKSDALDPNTPRPEDADSGEWGACWRLLNPQLYLKKEAWCQEKMEEGKQEENKEKLRLHLSFLSKEEAGNRKMINPKLKVSDWNDSWRLLNMDSKGK